MSPFKLNRNLSETEFAQLGIPAIVANGNVWAIPHGFTYTTQLAAKFFHDVAIAQLEGTLSAYVPNRPFMTDINKVAQLIADTLGDYTIVRNRLPLNF